jgi:hypothetical protein
VSSTSPAPSPTSATGSPSFVAVTATVLHWTDGEPQPVPHSVQTFAPSGTSDADLTTRIVSTFLQDRLGQPQDVESLVEAGSKGFLQVVQPPTRTSLTPPAGWHDTNAPDLGEVITNAFTNAVKELRRDEKEPRRRTAAARVTI